MISFLNNTSLSRGLRNNNPGNLVISSNDWEGKIPEAQNTDGTFEQFTTANYGIRAMAYDLMHDVNQNGYTLQQLITEYAPPSQNDTGAYINYVSSVTGLQPGERVTFSYLLLSEMLRVIIQVENGSQNAAMISDQDITDSIALLPQVLLTELGTYVKANPGKVIAGAFIVGGIAYAGYRFLKRAA